MMKRLFWSSFHRALLALAGTDDALWCELRRGLLMVVKSETAHASRQGLVMMAKAIEQRYGTAEADHTL